MIVKEKKTHTVEETLLKPCVLEMAKVLLGDDAAKQLSQMSLSNDTVHQRIIDLSQNILTQVANAITQSPAEISVQIDKSTEVSNHSQLLVFVRYVLVHKKNF